MPPSSQWDHTSLRSLIPTFLLACAALCSLMHQTHGLTQLPRASGRRGRQALTLKQLNEKQQHQAAPSKVGAVASASSQQPTALRGNELRALQARIKQTPNPRRSAPVSCTYTVGGSGGFKKIQDAVNKVGKNSASRRVTICIRAGTYFETVTINQGQDGITLYGDSPLSTTIASNKSLSQIKNTFLAATLIVWGNAFQARNIMVQNTLKTTKDPAPAVSILSASSQWDSVSLTAWQDTISIYTGNHSFTNSFISGIVDITWGFGRAAFVSSTIFIRTLNDPSLAFPGQVATYGTDTTATGAAAGGLFWNCTIDGDGTTYLGRPYREQSMAVFAYCYMGNAVVPAGYVDRRNYLTLKKYTYLEYKSKGPGARSSRKYGTVLKTDPPPAYTVQRFI